MTTFAPAVPAVLLRGDTEELLRDAALDVIDQLVAGGDRALLVDEFDGDEYELGALVDAAGTAPFLTDRRIVVGRGVSRFSKAEDVAPLVRYLSDPLPTSTVVLVWGGGRIPKSLTDAVSQAGGQVVDTSPSGGTRQVAAWVEEQCKRAEVRLDAAARQRIAEHLGEDLGRLPGVLASLEGAFPPGTRLGPADVEPYLGESGGVPPWELTDAIDRGDIVASLSLLHRMLGGGERHSLAVLATLHGHYSRLLRLDGARLRGEEEAAALLGLKVDRNGRSFPARKALDQSRRLGSERIRQAVLHLADADLALRGAHGGPPEVVLEVLVARLARLAPRR